MKSKWEWLKEKIQIIRLKSFYLMTKVAIPVMNHHLRSLNAALWIHNSRSFSHLTNLHIQIIENKYNLYQTKCQPMQQSHQQVNLMYPILDKPSTSIQPNKIFYLQPSTFKGENTCNLSLSFKTYYKLDRLAFIYQMKFYGKNKWVRLNLKVIGLNKTIL